MNATENYRKAVKELIKEFEEKQELEFEFFVGEGLEIACFAGDYFFNLSDIYLDLHTKAPKRLIFEWYFAQLDNPNKNINYRSYAEGLRFEDLNNKDTIK